MSLRVPVSRTSDINEARTIAQSFDKAGFHVGLHPEKQASAGGFKRGDEFVDERRGAEQAVTRQQAAGWQWNFRNGLPCEGELALIFPTEGGGEGVMRAEFDNHDAAEMGEGGLAVTTAAAVLDRPGLDGGGVAHVETCAVDAEEAKSPVESVGMLPEIGQGAEGGAKGGCHEFPADGSPALAQGAVGNRNTGDLFHVFGKIAGASHDMENLAHQPLPTSDFGQTPTSRAMFEENFSAGGLIKKLGEGSGKIS